YNDVRATLAKTRCAPEKLKLELTESVVMENPEQARLILAKLKDVGLGLALDDFGTGHSSLSYLTRFPFDTIKIDMALVRDGSVVITVWVRSVISMARELAMRVVAEGIESEEDAIDIFNIGIEFGQSYLFGPLIDYKSELRLRN